MLLTDMRVFDALSCEGVKPAGDLRHAAEKFASAVVSMEPKLAGKLRVHYAVYTDGPTIIMELLSPVLSMEVSRSDAGRVEFCGTVSHRRVLDSQEFAQGAEAAEWFCRMWRRYGGVNL